MATHSSVLAWRILGTGEPGGLLSVGSHRVRHDWNDLAAESYKPVSHTRCFVLFCFVFLSSTSPYISIQFGGSIPWNFKLPFYCQETSQGWMWNPLWLRSLHISQIGMIIPKRLCGYNFNGPGKGQTWFVLKEVTSYGFPPSINKSFTLFSAQMQFSK